MTSLTAVAVIVASGLCTGAPVPPCPVGQESLLQAGRRLASAWSRHDFDALTAGSGDVLVQLPGAPVTGALRPAQARELLRGFASGTQEASSDVMVAREVDDTRAYVEVQREFTVRGTAGRRRQTIYFGLRKEQGRWLLYEVRIVA